MKVYQRTVPQRKIRGSLIRREMSKSLPFEVSRHGRPIGRVAWTIRKQLHLVGSITIVIKPVTSIQIRPSSPGPQLLPRATLSKLATSKYLYSDSRYRRVVSMAHDVLPETVETVQDTIHSVVNAFAVVHGYKGLPNELLQSSEHD